MCSYLFWCPFGISKLIRYFFRLCSFFYFIYYTGRGKNLKNVSWRNLFGFSEFEYQTNEKRIYSDCQTNIFHTSKRLFFLLRMLETNFCNFLQLVWSFSLEIFKFVVAQLVESVFRTLFDVKYVVNN